MAGPVNEEVIGALFATFANVKSQLEEAENKLKSANPV